MKKFGEMLLMMATIYNKELSVPVIEMYYTTLERFPEDKLLAAGQVLMAGQFFPRPFDFTQLLEPEASTIEDRAQAAWSQLKGYAWGQRSIPDDSLYHAAMAGICDIYCIKHASEKELIGYGFEFRAAFRVLAEQEKADETRELIEGQAAGLIGDAAKHLGMGHG